MSPQSLSQLETMSQEDYTPELEIPFALADQWDEMLKTKGKCATYWEIANWAYQRGQSANVTPYRKFAGD